MVYETFAFTLTYRARLLILEPLSHATCMSSMLTCLAPKKPFVNLVIQVFRLILLKIEEFIHGVQDCY